MIVAERFTRYSYRQRGYSQTLLQPITSANPFRDEEWLVFCIQSVLLPQIIIQLFQLGLIQIGLIQLGLIQLGLIQIGLIQIGLIQIDIVSKLLN